MKEVIALLNQILLNEEIIYAVISDQRKKDEESYSKVTVKPVLINDELNLQFTYSYKTKVLHKNLIPAESLDLIEKLLVEDFKQAIFLQKRQIITY